MICNITRSIISQGGAEDKSHGVKGGERAVTKEKLNNLVEALSGLHAYEWSRVRKAVDHILDWKYAHLELDDPKEIRANLELEIGAPDNE